MVGADILTLWDFPFSTCFSAALSQHYWLYIACLSMKLHVLLCWELETQKFLLFHHLPAVRKYRGKDPSSPQHSISPVPALCGFLGFSFVCAVDQQGCPRLVLVGT